MEKKIAIQKGNTCYLQVTLTQTLTDGHTVTPCDISEFRSLGFAMVRSVRGVPAELRFLVEDAEQGKVIVEVPPTLSESHYALCVSASRGTDKLRTLELVDITIVGDNSQVSLPDGTYEGQSSYGIDVKLQLYTGMALAVDDDVIDGSLNAVSGGAVYRYLAIKEQDITEALSTVSIAVRNADLAAEHAHDVADELMRAKEAGEFNGKDGDPGAPGKDGADGSILYPSVSIDAAGYLVAEIPDEAEGTNLSLDADGYLCVDFPDIK